MNLSYDQEANREVDFHSLDLSPILDRFAKANKSLDKSCIYDDMVNIVSPGAFPSTITQEDLLEGRSEIRNKVIARVFKELNYIEQWGSGIRRIKSSCKTRGLKEPEIVEKGDFVDVSLYREVIDADEVINDIPELSHQEEKVIEYLKANENRITTREAESVLDVAERRARKILKDMVGKGILKRVGKTTNTHYRMKDIDAK
jgi:ATP-dependent DNA helicase RecG